MTDQARTLELDFELETPDDQADAASLERSAAAVAERASALPGVDNASAEVSGPARMVDPISLGVIALTVKYVIKDSSEIVGSLDELVNQVKQLARDLGLPHLKVWLGTRKVDASELTPDTLSELADEAAG